MILQEFFFPILPSFEIKLEILNIMLVCKFEINWSINTNLRALSIYPDGRPAFPYPPLRFLQRRGTKTTVAHSEKCWRTLSEAIFSCNLHIHVWFVWGFFWGFFCCFLFCSGCFWLLKISIRDITNNTIQPQTGHNLLILPLYL